MGTTHSSPNTAVGGASQQGLKVGAHNGIPKDHVPYPGPQWEYCFVDIEALLKAKVKFLSAPILTTNIDAYCEVISRPYTQGFVMNQFQSIPGVMRQGGFSSKIAMPFQAILSRPVNAPPTHERWQLQIEKSFLHTQMALQFMTSKATIQSDSSDIYQKINAVTAQGGRLICVEITGLQKGLMQTQSRFRETVRGVDLFFNMPLHPNPTIYIYQAISVPVQLKLKSSFGYPRIQVLTDFMGQLAAFLQKGWKLVEINFDCSLTTQPGFMRAHATLNSIWFFEKEASKMHSEVPEWEGTIVEYEHKFGRTFGGTKAKTNWDPVVSEMGQHGWELACLVESPEMYTTGFSTAAVKVFMFFQRRIIRPPGAQGFTGHPQAQLSPPQGSYPMGGSTDTPPEAKK